MGLRLRWLGTDLLTWGDLQSIVRGAPRESAIGQSLGGPGSAWSNLEHLVALSLDALNIANWQRQGNKHAPRPRPVSRPGAVEDGQRLGSDPIPIGQFEDWWNSAN